MKKKFLALVMTLSMVLSLVPMTALATGDSQAGQTLTAAEGQTENAATNGDDQKGDSTTGGDNAGSRDSADTSKDSGANTENKGEGKDSGSENTDGTTTGDSSTSGTGSTEGGDTGTPTPPESPNKVAKNIDTHAEYETLDAAIAEAGNGAKIEVLADCTTAGLELRKDLTIQGAEGLEPKPTIKFTDKGIALWGKALTFKNCNVEMKGIGSTPYTAEWNSMTVCASKDASLSLYRATMTMDGENAGDKHAIYFCSNNKLNLLNNSKLEIKNYKQDALEWDGGDGGYNVNITGNSTFISDHNRSAFTGTFYAMIDNSTV